MSWYYADGGAQVGPVEDPALDDLVRAGVVRDDTLVWREGMASWQPHGAVRGPKPAASVPAGYITEGFGFCSECGGRFSAPQLAMFGSRQMCTPCGGRLSA
jgi:GYF domain 2